MLMLPLLSGCWSTNRKVAQNELPADWHAAVEQRARHSIDIEGVYQDVGERLEKSWMTAKADQGRLVFPRTRSTSYLAGLAGFSYTPGSRPVLIVEFAVDGPRKLRAVVRDGTTVVSERIWDAEWNPKARAWVLESRSKAPGLVSSASRLFKGLDGRLYLRWRSG